MRDDTAERDALILLCRKLEAQRDEFKELAAESLDRYVAENTYRAEIVAQIQKVCARHRREDNRLLLREVAKIVGYWIAPLPEKPQQTELLDEL